MPTTVGSLGALPPDAQRKEDEDFRDDEMTPDWIDDIEEHLDEALADVQHGVLSTGTFTGDADQVAASLRKQSASPQQAIKRLVYFMNQAGSNLSADRRSVLKQALKQLQAQEAKLTHQQRIIQYEDSYPEPVQAVVDRLQGDGYTVTVEPSTPGSDLWWVVAEGMSVVLTVKDFPQVVSVVSSFGVDKARVSFGIRV